MVAQRTQELLDTCFNRAMDDENKDQGNMLRFLVRMRGYHDERPREGNVNINAENATVPVLVIGQTGQKLPSLEDLKEMAQKDDYIEGELDD
jgi:hypothetical protein